MFPLAETRSRSASVPALFMVVMAKNVGTMLAETVAPASTSAYI